jgi:hypothetical protein
MTPLRRLRRAAIDVEPLRHAAFRRLWAGNSRGFVDFQLTAVAVAVQVYELTGRGSRWGWSGWSCSAAGAGRWPTPSTAGCCCCWGRRCCCGAAPGGCWGRPWPGWPACPCCWDWSPSRRPGSPSPPRPRGAIVPRVLPEALVPSANTLSFTASNVGLALGPLLAGLILARWSFAAAYAADLAVFTFALYAAARLPALPPAGPATTPGLRSVVGCTSSRTTSGTRSAQPGGRRTRSGPPARPRGPPRVGPAPG